MKKVLLLGLAVGFVVVGNSVPASAVNCAQVLKYLKTGRTPDEIAETMVIDVDEVKKCQEQADKGPAATPAGEKK
jgi:hypothetical protein